MLKARPLARKPQCSGGSISEPLDWGREEAGGGVAQKRAWLFTLGREFPWLKSWHQPPVSASCLPSWPPAAPIAKDKPKQPGQRLYPNAVDIRVCIGRSCLLGKHHHSVFFFFFLFKQALLSTGHITLHEASQCC